MQWFKHDTNSHRDAKLKRVMIKYGMEGYGLYFYCLELIAGAIDKNNITFELEHDAEIIAHDTGIHYERVQEMMEYMIKLALFEHTDGTVTCLKLAKRLDQSMTGNTEMRRLINQLATSHDTVMIDHDSIMKEKEKEKEKNTTAQNFARFWSAYPNKKSKGRAEKTFKRINPSEQLMADIMSGIQRAKTSEQWLKDSGRFIPHPSTWLNAKGWEDDLQEVPDFARGAI